MLMRPIPSTVLAFLLLAIISSPSPSHAAGLRVRGQVLRPDGTVPATAHIALQPIEASYAAAHRVLSGGDLEPPPAASVTVDAAGRFALTAPSPGLWRLVIRAAGHVPLRREPLAVVEDLELPTVTLQADVELAVRVVTVDGSAVAGAWVMAREIDPAPWATVLAAGFKPYWRVARSDAAGRVELPRAVAEALALHVVSAGGAAHDLAVIADDHRPPAGGAFELVLPASEHRDLRVVDARGLPMPGVLALSGALRWPVAVADEAGRLGIPLPAGAGGDLLLLAADGRRLLWRIGPRAAAQVVVVPDLLHVTGRVVDRAAGGPLPGALLWPRDDPGQRAWSDAQGRFALGIPPRGTEESSPPRPDPLLLAEAAGHVGASVRVAGEEIREEISLRRRQRVFGWLVDPEDLPIVGGTVQWTQDGDDGGVRDGHGSATDLAGRFVFEDVSAARFDLHARAAGFAPLVVRGLERAEQGGDLDAGTLVLARGELIRGRVVGRHGEPLAEVTVQAFPAGAPQLAPADAVSEWAAVSDAAGAFSLGDLAAGQRLDLSFEAPGFTTAWIRGVEAPAADLLAELRPTARLVGSVTDSAGEPVAGAEIIVQSQTTVPGAGGRLPVGEVAERRQWSETDGTFVVTDVPAGEASLRAWAEGFVPSPPLALVVAADSDEAGGPWHLVLERGGIVEGRVTTARGQAVAEVVVGDGEVEARSDGEGFYRLAGLPLGPVELVTDHPAYPRTFASIDVEAGVRTLDIVLPNGQEVGGVVVDESGQPLAGARVSLAGRVLDDWRQLETASGADGSFYLAAVTEGTYQLSAEHPAKVPAEPRDLQVGEAPIADLRIVLQQGLTVRGQVLGLGFEDLARARVGAEDAAGRWLEGRLRYDGAFEITALSAGDWLLRATTDGERREARRRVVLDAERAGQRFDLEFQGGLVLSGQVLLAGEPLPETRLSLSGLDVDTERSAVTTYDGRFQVEDLHAGTYRLGLTNRRQLLVHNQILELDGDRELVVELEAGAVDGQVSSAADGQPLDGVLVVLERLLDNAAAAAFIVTGGTDTDGRFELPRVPAGAYRLAARKDGFAVEERTLTLAAGERASDLHLQLLPTAGLVLEARVEGRIPPQVHLAVLDAAGRTVLSESRTPEAEGKAVFRTVPSGGWRILVSAPGAATIERQVELPAALQVVDLPAAGTLRLRVPALADNPHTAILQLWSPGGAPFLALGLGGRLQDRWPVVGGSAQVDGLPAGIWNVEIHASASGETWAGTVATPGHGVLEVAIE